MSLNTQEKAHECERVFPEVRSLKEMVPNHLKLAMRKLGTKDLRLLNRLGYELIAKLIANSWPNLIANSEPNFMFFKQT